MSSDNSDQDEHSEEVSADELGSSMEWDEARDSHEEDDDAGSQSDPDADEQQDDDEDENGSNNENQDDNENENVDEDGSGEGEGDDVEGEGEGDDVDEADLAAVREAERKAKRAKLLELGKGHKPGIIYVSRLPPNMHPHHLKLYLRDYGTLMRVYCAPEPEEKTAARAKRGGNKRRQFTEAWVEFARRKDAKNAALVLNGRPMGGKNKRSPFYFDIWNVKYLRKFTWDNLTEDLKKKKRLQEKRLHAQISQATREAQTYLEQRESARIGDKIIERREKQKQKEAAAQSDSKPLKSESGDKKVTSSASQASDKEAPSAGPRRRDERKQLDDGFLAQFLGGGGSSSKVKEERPRQGMKRARDH